MIKSELFQPIAADQLIAWVFSELETQDSIFGIPRQHFFTPRAADPFRTAAFGHPLDTPFGPAAGPHSQMAQNIVAAWLCGARYIELKTVQTLDVLDVSKPCIDMEDEGYNVEWSQELKVYQSFDEYLRAWVLIHALHHKLGFPGELPGIVFNLSVGYNLEGIQRPNMQWFLDQMQDCSAYKQAVVDAVASYYPPVRDLPIPDCISDNVTLSTMHGCPPGEIESISCYLLRERHLHTMVKCNPTLLGAERVRDLLNKELKYVDVTVPDQAFEHDLKYADAVPMLRNLQAVAKECGLVFGVKLSNTLEVENFRPVFAATEKMMYLSGRPLHAITVNLAYVLTDEFVGQLPMSFSAGATCFNSPELLAAGMQTVTVCSDLLKTGGYMRLLDYVDAAENAIRDSGATTINEFILRSANSPPGASVVAAVRDNLRQYSERSCADPHNIKSTFATTHTKTARALELFDCIKAPCVGECPLGQKVPQYMNAVRGGDIAAAQTIVNSDNPIPCILGRVCDHLCEQVCIRTHLDEPLAIRDIKRFITDSACESVDLERRTPINKKVAIIGAGPGGIAAASELAKAGVQVEIFEQQPYAGGMVGGAVPEYRLPQEIFDKDFMPLQDLCVKVHFNMKAGRDIRLSQLRRDGFDEIVIMVGAQLSKLLGLAGEDCDGMLDALQFLRSARESQSLDLGKRVGIIGAGDTAMDCARTARRCSDSHVTLIYRRSIDQMPADREEITHLIEEGVEVLELAKPERLIIENGRLRALQCRRMEFSGDRDSTGRKNPREVPGADFEVPLDTMILAISQHAVLDFFDDVAIAVNSRGYIDADPQTFATSVPGIYAGGDVVNDGPSSIVKAAAAGKAIADSILQRRSGSALPTPVRSFDRSALLRRRAHRAWRVPVSVTPLADRQNFNEVVQTYTEAEAKTEAARCLDCDTYCSICVGVCPNLALQTWQTEPLTVRLPLLQVADGALKIAAGDLYRVDQAYQVAVLNDFCNECGNCTTFCPTAGRPYQDKPRLFVDRASFEEQRENAFMVSNDDSGWSMDSRWQGATHHIELNGSLEYSSPLLRARLDPLTFAVEQAELLDKNATELSLEPCAAMFVLLRGIQKSMPYWATPAMADVTAGKIPHPGYEE